MTLLQYYIYANIYVIAFWMFFRICLKNHARFHWNRIYLISAVILSLLLPYLQNSISTLVVNSKSILGISAENLPEFGFIYSYVEYLSAENVDSISWSVIVNAILIAGAMVTAMTYLNHHVRIISIIKHSKEKELSGQNINVLLSEQVTIPFIYHHWVVLPNTISDEETKAVIDHELLHHRLGHHHDNLLFSFIHIIFWINPMFVLLKRELKLNHEYQVDQQIISSGIDPVSYKLSLIKYCVGERKFLLANGLSSTKIKNRLIMINNRSIYKGKWRFFLIIPTLTIILVALSLACNQAPEHEAIPEHSVAISSAEPVMVEFIQMTYEDIKHTNKGGLIAALMNRNSEIMIAGEKLPLDGAENKIISEYMKRIEATMDHHSAKLPESQLTEIRVVVQKDLATNSENYQILLDAISSAQLKLRNIYSNELYAGDFDSLADSDKDVISKLIPLRIFGISPDKNMGRSDPKSSSAS